MTMITRWSPVRDFVSLREAMDRLLEDSYVRHNGWVDENGEHVARLPIDVYSTEDEIVVTASVPGLKAEDVEITVEGDTLRIRGEIPPMIENVDYAFAERYHGSFSRTLQLNVPIDLDKVEATFENGLLVLRLPKAEETKPKVIKVQAKS
jgi:HSP20 family protein